jgi:hypothetical protein
MTKGEVFANFKDPSPEDRRDFDQWLQGCAVVEHRSRRARPLRTPLVLGLAVFLSAAFAQEQPIPGAQSSGLDINKSAHFQIWRTITLGTYRGVDAYRDALD